MNPTKTTETDWLLLITSLPTSSATERMRVWRALKALGCAVLRDGAYLLPRSDGAEHRLGRLAAETVEAGGEAQLLAVAARDAGQERNFRGRFDRGADYAEFLKQLAGAEPRRLPALRRQLEAIKATDIFPGPARDQAEAALAEREAATSPDEPTAQVGRLRRLDASQFKGRLWATRQGPWIDRLASAWLIRRFIDPQARFRWLAKPADCPKNALGFDFDGATFSHVGHRVTFETLLASFGLEADLALARLAALVHFLDVGGAPVAEAAGVEAVLAGLKRQAADDDALLAAATAILDGLYDIYREGAAP